jgi:hypothetical protein
VTQSEDRLDRIEEILVAVARRQQSNADAIAQQHQNNAVIVASQNAAIAKVIELQQSNAFASASHSATIATILEQQQTNTQAIAQLGTQLESSTQNLIQTIDYAMDRMEQILRQSLNPSQNGNPPLEF